MTKLLNADEIQTTQELLAHILYECKQGERVQFLVDPSMGSVVVQRLRVALSRSRERNRRRGKKIDEFTLRHDIYPYTNRVGKRHDCVVMWTEKNRHHVTREILDDILERKQ